MQTNTEKYSCHSIGGAGLGSSGYSSSGTNLNLNNTNNNNNNNVYASYVTGSKNNQVIYHGSSDTTENNCNKYDNINTSFMHNDELANEVISRSGPSNIYQRKDYSHEISALAQQNGAGVSVTSSFQDEFNTKSSANNSSIYNSYEENFGNANIIKIDPPPQLNSSSIINQDPDPIRIVKPNTQNIVYKQEVKIKYLQPPTPPPPAPIIIREKQLAAPPPQPPIIIRYF